MVGATTPAGMKPQGEFRSLRIPNALFDPLLEARS